jgi:hypothetical protein
MYLSRRHVSALAQLLYVLPGFNAQHFYVLPTQCIYVFCVGLRTFVKKTTIEFY